MEQNAGGQELTKEQIEAQKKAQKAQEAADKKAKAEADKKAKEEAKAAAKQKAEEEKKAKEEAKAKEKADKEQAKADAKAKAEADKKAKEEAKAKAKADKEASKQPNQNGITRPRPDGQCGKVWKLADDLSANLGSPTPIAELLKQAQALGINDSTIRTQYARWRKFHGVSGRIVAEAKPASNDGQAAAAA